MVKGASRLRDKLKEMSGPTDKKIAGPREEGVFPLIIIIFVEVLDKFTVPLAPNSMAQGWVVVLVFHLQGEAYQQGSGDLRTRPLEEWEGTGKKNLAREPEGLDFLSGLKNNPSGQVGKQPQSQPKKNVKDKDYNLGTYDVHTSGQSIWKILSRRYQVTGLPYLFEERSQKKQLQKAGKKEGKKK